MAAVLMLAACGGDDDDDGGGASETTEGGGSETTTGELTASFRGVTADTIKLGVMIVDYEAIKDFVDFHRGDQQTIAQYFVDDINENGGILGRQIEPVYKEYPPIPGMEPNPLSLCTALTEDDEVFAVVGVFIDFTGEGQLCLTREHQTIHIGHELEQPWIDESPPALLLTPDTTKERATQTLLTLFEEEGTLEGKTVGIVADQDSEGRANDVIRPGLEDLGVEVGDTAVLSITSEDTTQAQAQLDSFIEKWKSQNVDTIFFAGLTVSAKQFVEKVKEAIPDALLITDADSTAQQGQDEVSAGKVPNPYEGMLSVSGASASERWQNKNELFQRCVDVYEERSGQTLLGPDEVTPDADGRTAELYTTVTDFCGELQMFKTIAEKAGPNLTNETWTEAVNNFGTIEIVPTDIASLCEGKYTADDQARIVSFDSSIGENGDWAPVTDIIDASGGECTKNE
jgi:hypothetical protein